MVGRFCATRFVPGIDTKPDAGPFFSHRMGKADGAGAATGERVNWHGDQRDKRSGQTYKSTLHCFIE
jgi:hypothetical protein